MQFAQCRGAVDTGETAALVDDFACHHDEGDTVALRALDDGVEDRGLRIEIGVGELVPVDQHEIGGLADGESADMAAIPVVAAPPVVTMRSTWPDRKLGESLPPSQVAGRVKDLSSGVRRGVRAGSPRGRDRPGNG